MADVVFSNFKNGYDKRRSELTTQAGSLLLLQDMFVNEGAELEKRKAWQNAAYRPVNSFGLETTTSGVLWFSSGYYFCATATRARTTGGLVTITLTNPSYSAGGTYNLQYTFSGQEYLWTPGANDTELVDGATTLLAAGGAQTFISTGTTTLHGTNSTLITAKVTYYNIFPLFPNLVPGNAPIFSINASQTDSIVVTGMGDANVNGTWPLVAQTGTTITFQTPTTGSAYGTTADTAGVVVWDGLIGGGNVYFQTLLHPAVSDGAVYNHTYHDMVSVACSTAFGSGAWVAAKFTDGNTFVFWNGLYVAAFRNGQILAGLDTATYGSNVGIATQIRNYINSLQLSGFLINTVQTSGGSAYFYLYAPVGDSVTVLASTTSTNKGTGTLVPTQLSLGYQAVTGVAANASFAIVAGTTGSITKVATNYNGDNYTTNLLQGTVAFTTTTQQLAINVAVSIAGNPSTSVPYTAIANQNAVLISDKTNAGTAMNGVHLQVTATGNLCVDNIPFNFTSAWTTADTITNIKWDVTGADTEILGTTMTFGSETLAAFLGRVAAQIIANNNGYTAAVVAGTSGQPVNSQNLYISRLVTTSATSIAAMQTGIIFTSTSGTVTNGLSGGTTTNPNALNVTITPQNSTFNVPHGAQTVEQYAASIVGGIAPYNFTWTITNNNTTNATLATWGGSGPASGITSANSLQYGVVVTASDNIGAGTQGTISLTVVDNVGNRTSVSTGYTIKIF